MVNMYRRQFPRRAASSHAGAQAKRRGVAAAELAVCLPIVVLLVLATIEACTMVFLKQSLTVASYEGVRTALVKGATSQDVQTACKQILTDRNVDGAIVTVSPANIPALNPGDLVDVTVTAPCGPNSVLPIMFYQGKSLTTTASMMIEF
jgi:Flp pilus assembly protein TadG